ncbi:MAG TPA: type II toxin-antitoxin system VapC family toxin [Candidatus Dormibacteraeota bacterium]|nr:type II toxin-antitoxin system VapC family toxin [Candidatus Dormibacteraeota bacterium]
MNGRAAYLDTSAFVKLVVVEPESEALRRFLMRWPERTSAALLRTEAIRALRRSGHDSRVGAARRLFSAMRLVRLDEPLLDRAGDLDPRELRSLDAVHLATALAIGPDLGVLLTYDERLEDAARQQGLAVQSPC